MSEAELIFTALAELSTRQIADSEKAKGLTENAKASEKGGAVAKNARKELESKTGKSVISRPSKSQFYVTSIKIPVSIYKVFTNK